MRSFIGLTQGVGVYPRTFIAPRWDVLFAHTSNDGDSEVWFGELYHALDFMVTHKPCQRR